MCSRIIACHECIFIEFQLININRLFHPPLYPSLLSQQERREDQPVTMVFSTSFSPVSYSNITVCERPSFLHKTGSPTKPTICFDSSVSSSYSVPSFNHVISKSIVTFAASATILLSSHPAKAGFMSGFSGIESTPGPELPKLEFLERFNEENQKKYAENDARFKESPLLKKLLEKSKLNKEKNQQLIQDKYCLRGAEWGVGDCSAEAMSPEDRDNFIAMLKKKTGIDE